MGGHCKASETVDATALAIVKILNTLGSDCQWNIAKLKDLDTRLC